MKKSATEIITVEQLKALREAGFVVVHGSPTESMNKAGLSAAKRMEGSLEQTYHRMVAESIRLQSLEASPSGCGAALGDGQWFKYCGETDMGQTAPALCKRCGGEFETKT